MNALMGMPQGAESPDPADPRAALRRREAPRARARQRPGAADLQGARPRASWTTTTTSKPKSRGDRARPSVAAARRPARDDSDAQSEPRRPTPTTADRRLTAPVSDLRPRRPVLGTPVHAVGPDGRMALADHLRELRARILRVAVGAARSAFVVASSSSTSCYDLVYGPTSRPRRRCPRGRAPAYIKGAGGALLLQLKLCGFAALIGTSPYWLYQIWAFILPGLHPTSASGRGSSSPSPAPLFFLGVSWATSRCRRAWRC